MSIWKQLRGTFETLLQLGKDGPQLKQSGIHLDVRNDVDGAYVNVRGLDPVVAQDFVTKNYGDTNYVYTHPNHTGDVTSVGDGAQTIANNAVTNAKAADMAPWTIKLRNNVASGDPQDVKTSALTLKTAAAGDFLLGEASTGELRRFNASSLLKMTQTAQFGIRSNNVTSGSWLETAGNVATSSTPVIVAFAGTIQAVSGALSVAKTVDFKVYVNGVLQITLSLVAVAKATAAPSFVVAAGDELTVEITHATTGVKDPSFSLMLLES